MKRNFYPTLEMKFQYLRKLELNNMNYSKTANELKINRINLYRYKKKYWEYYMLFRKPMQKSEVEIHPIQLDSFDNYQEANLEACHLALRAILDIIRLPLVIEKISINDIIKLNSTFVPIILASSKDSQFEKLSNEFFLNHTPKVLKLANFLYSKYVKTPL